MTRVATFAVCETWLGQGAPYPPCIQGTRQGKPPEEVVDEADILEPCCCCELSN